MEKNLRSIKKKEELKTVCYNLFFMRDFLLASYVRVIDIGVIESRSFDTFLSFKHSLLWIEGFSERKVYTIHSNFPIVSLESSLLP